MKIISILSFLIIMGSVSYGQNLIGYNDYEIRKFMKDNKREMNFDKVMNNKFIYLKYSDNSDSQTILFFLSPDSVCKNVRIICERGMITDKVKEYDKLYKKNGNNKWIDRHGGKDYLIEIKDEKWSCVITIEPGK
jgi:hypothetical protein